MAASALATATMASSPLPRPNFGHNLSEKLSTTLTIKNPISAGSNARFPFPNKAFTSRKPALKTKATAVGAWNGRKARASLVVPRITKYLAVGLVKLVSDLERGLMHSVMTRSRLSLLVMARFIRSSLNFLDTSAERSENTIDSCAAICSLSTTSACRSRFRRRLILDQRLSFSSNDPKATTTDPISAEIRIEPTPTGSTGTPRSNPVASVSR